MLSYLRPRPVRTGAVPRAFLQVDLLEPRHCPSGWDGTLSDGVDLSSYDPPPENGGGTRTGSQPPEITAFCAAAQGHGFYIFSGTVKDANPAGVVVRFGGIPSMEGESTTCDADGNFSIAVVLKTDGTDCGAVTAIATDSLGLQSNEDWVDVDPFG
jgi:hypothetical protein